jgi:hypothetical protein
VERWILLAKQAEERRLNNPLVNVMTRRGGEGVCVGDGAVERKFIFFGGRVTNQRARCNLELQKLPNRETIAQFRV